LSFSVTFPFPTPASPRTCFAKNHPTRCRFLPTTDAVKSNVLESACALSSFSFIFSFPRLKFFPQRSTDSLSELLFLSYPDRMMECFFFFGLPSPTSSPFGNPVRLDIIMQSFLRDGGLVKFVPPPSSLPFSFSWSISSF